MPDVELCRWLEPVFGPVITISLLILFSYWQYRKGKIIVVSANGNGKNGKDQKPNCVIAQCGDHPLLADRMNRMERRLDQGDIAFNEHRSMIHELDKKVDVLISQGTLIMKMIEGQHHD